MCKFLICFLHCLDTRACAFQWRTHATGRSANGCVCSAPVVLCVPALTTAWLITARVWNCLHPPRPPSVSYDSSSCQGVLLFIELSIVTRPSRASFLILLIRSQLPRVMFSVWTAAVVSWTPAVSPSAAARPATAARGARLTSAETTARTEEPVLRHALVFHTSLSKTYESSMYITLHTSCPIHQFLDNIRLNLGCWSLLAAVVFLYTDARHR